MAPRRFLLARLGADVLGIDIAKNLVDAGNRRALEAGLSRLKFQEGDASNLHGVDDHSFDLTLSVFGAMFAPRPFDVAREMVKVTKPGGRIVETHIIEQFGQAGVPKESISMIRDTYQFISRDSPTHFIDTFRRFYGPTMNAFEAAEKTGKVEELHNQLLELAKAQNTNSDGGTSIPATFLRINVYL